MGIMGIMDLTRRELQKQWKQSTTNEQFRAALKQYGPRAAFGQFRDFVWEVRNDYRPDLSDLLTEWQISVAALRSNLTYHNIVIGEVSPRLASWIKRADELNQSRSWIMDNFRVGNIALGQVLGKHIRALDTISFDVDDLRQWFIDGLTLSDIAKIYNVSTYSVSKYLIKNNLVYDENLIKAGIVDHIARGTRVSEIANIYNICHTTATRYVRMWGLSVPDEFKEIHAAEDADRRSRASRRGAEVVKQRSNVALIELSKVVVPLYTSGKSIRGIANEVGWSEGSIDKALRLAGVQLPTKQQRSHQLSVDSMNKWLAAPRDGYDYSLVTLDDWKSGKIKIVCSNHGQFTQLWPNHFSLGVGCPKCINSGVSKAEDEIANFIRGLGLAVEQSNRSVLGGREIDIFIPDKKVGIEFNGLYWHSSADPGNTMKDRHLYKTNQCEAQDITLLHINSDEWDGGAKQSIWKSVIKTKLGLVDRRIPARKTKISVVSNSTAKTFLESNHLQGSANGKNIALTFDDEIVAMLVYGKSRFEKNATEVLRICTIRDTLVMGGVSKLIKYLRNVVDGPIVSYANRRWSRGNVYSVCGFKLIKNTPPNYQYVMNGSTLISRYRCQKHKLPKLLGNMFDPSKTELHNMLNAGYRILYDSGNMKFVYD